MKKPIMWVAALLTASCTPALKVEVANTTPTERDDETVEIAWSEVAALKGRVVILTAGIKYSDFSGCNTLNTYKTSLLFIV